MSGRPQEVGAVNQYFQMEPSGSATSMLNANSSLNNNFHLTTFPEKKKSEKKKNKKKKHHKEQSSTTESNRWTNHKTDVEEKYKGVDDSRWRPKYRPSELDDIAKFVSHHQTQRPPLLDSSTATPTTQHFQRIPKEFTTEDSNGSTSGGRHKPVHFARYTEMHSRPRQSAINNHKSSPDNSESTTPPPQPEPTSTTTTTPKADKTVFDGQIEMAKKFARKFRDNSSREVSLPPATPPSAHPRPNPSPAPPPPLSATPPPTVQILPTTLTSNSNTHADAQQATGNPNRPKNVHRQNHIHYQPLHQAHVGLLAADFR